MTAGAQASRRSGDHLNSNILRPPLRNVSRTTAESDVWNAMRAEAEAALIEEPLYAGIIQATVLDQPSLIHAFAYRLAHRLGDGDLARLSTRDLCLSAFQADPYAGDHAVRDLVAIRRARPHLPALPRPLSVLQGPCRPGGLPRRPLALAPGPRHPRAAYPEPNLRGVRGRYPPGRANRLGGVHRPRHRGRHRRDHGDRR